MVRLLNASISQPPPPPRVEGWEWGCTVRDRDCEFMMYGSGSVEALFSPEWTKNKLAMRIQIMINVAYQSLLPSLWSTSSWSSEKPLQQLQPGTAPCISAFFTISDSKRYAPRPGRPRPVRPCQGLRGWQVYMTVCGTMSWFPAANSLLEFLCLIIQKARSLKSWKNLISNPHYHYQKNCSWFKEKKLSQSCRPSKKLTVIIHNTRRRNTRRLLRGFALLEMTYSALARFGRILRGVPRAVFSFTITRYLVRMKRK